MTALARRRMMMVESESIPTAEWEAGVWGFKVDSTDEIVSPNYAKDNALTGEFVKIDRITADMKGYGASHSGQWLWRSHFDKDAVNPSHDYSHPNQFSGYTNAVKCTMWVYRKYAANRDIRSQSWEKTSVSFNSNAGSNSGSDYYFVSSSATMPQDGTYTFE